MPGARSLALAVAATLACGNRDQAPPAALRAAGPSSAAAAPNSAAPQGRSKTATADRFPELVGLPRAKPLRTLEIPVRIDVPRFDVHGPVVPRVAAPAVAVVAGSQLGFVAIDWRRGEVAWTRPGGAHVAPPVALPGGELALLGDCAVAPPTDEPVLGCLRVVTAEGVDRGDSAIVASAALFAKSRAPGPQRAWAIDERRVAWQRGEVSVTLDVATGAARGGAPEPPALLVRHEGVELAIRLDDEGELRAFRGDDRGSVAWRGRGRIAALLGVRDADPPASPTLRIARPSTVRSVGDGGAPNAFDILDVDALTGTGAQAATPAPGILLLASATGARGEAALVMRLDSSLRRDYVIAYTPSAHVAWVAPLPDGVRPDPVGVALTPDAVLVFHDGDTVTVLPPIE